MDYVYRASLDNDPDGGFLVTFEDVPEAITHGDTRETALANAAEALGLALRGYVAAGLSVTRPMAQQGIPVAVNAMDAIKLAVIDAFNHEGISKSELARRLGKQETEARRLLDPDHPSKLGALQDALRVMNRRLSISVDAA